MHVDNNEDERHELVAKESQNVSADDIWPPSIGQFVFGLFEDGVFPGEVKSVQREEIEVSILFPTKVPSIATGESLWKRPSLTAKSVYKVHRDSILPFHPVMSINRYSTHRIVIYEVHNYDIAEEFF